MTTHVTKGSAQELFKRLRKSKFEAGSSYVACAFVPLSRSSARAYIACNSTDLSLETMNNELSSEASRAYRSPFLARTCSVVAVAALSLGLAACDKSPNSPTVGQQVDSAIQKTEQAGAEAKVKAQAAIDKTQSKIDSGEVGAAMRNAGNAASELAADSAITAQVSAELARDADLSAIRIDVDTHDGAVRLSGPAPSQIAKDRATTLAQGVKGVLSVSNDLIVKPS